MKLVEWKTEKNYGEIAVDAKNDKKANCSFVVKDRDLIVILK